MFKRSLIRLFNEHRRYILVPPNQSDPIKTNQEVIKELTKKLTGGESSYNPAGSAPVSNTNLPKSQDDLEPRKMSDSFDHALIPLSSDEDLRNRYLTSQSEWPRMGRLLEDMDVFAVHLIHKHVKLPNQEGGKLPFSIVTALVDQIKVHSVLSHHLDFKISGHVTWVGRSSAETTLNLHQKNETGNAWNKVIEAQFLMVATDPLKRGPVFFNPLQLESKEEEDLFEGGRQRTQARKLKSKESLLRQPPNPQEQKLIHDIFVETLDKKSISFEGRIVPPNSVWMDHAKLKSSVLCQPEKRNRSNKVFGGYIMRQAMELAWTNAYVFAGAQRPNIEFMDDILFDKPVDIGSVLHFSSQVAYTFEDYVQVRVGAKALDTKGEMHETNVFHYTFRMPGPVKRVIPKTYQDSMIFLNAKRHFDECQKGV